MVSLTGKESLRARDKKRVPVLDGVRGLCAMGVIWTHIAFSTFVRSAALGPPRDGIWSILTAGQLSLGPFFVLSGLLLYRPFARWAILGTPRPSLKTFFVRRGVRLLPAFWVMTAVALLVLNLNALHGAWDVIRPFVLMHIYSYHYYAGLDVAWTVPAEAQFYLALPILGLVLHQVARTAVDPAQRARRMLLCIVVFLPIEWGWTLYVHGELKLWPPQYFYPLSICGMWALGMALAIWAVLAEASPDNPPAIFRLSAKRPNLFWLGALVAYAINCAAPFSHPGTADWQGAPAALSSDLCLEVFSFLLIVPLIMPDHSSRIQRAVLGNWPARYLGRISYGMYVWHFFFIYVRMKSGSAFGKIIPINLLLGKYAFWQLYLPVLAATIIAASLSFYLLERPIARLAEQYLNRGRAPAIAVATAGVASVGQPGEPSVPATDGTQAAAKPRVSAGDENQLSAG
jgi:peptidoglycan/LPS O-acetylase OafA/YrhL